MGGLRNMDVGRIALKPPDLHRPCGAAQRGDVETVLELCVRQEAGGAVAGVKTDRVLISNGDRLEGEIKQLERGSLTFKTTATDKIGIRQDLVLRLTSPRRFEVETESGERYFGHLDEPASDRMLRVVADDQVHDFDLDEVVRIYPIESKFLKRIDGSVSAGFNTTASSDVSRLTFGSNVEYSAERYDVYASFSSISVGS